MEIPTIEWSGSGLKLDVEACKKTGEVSVPEDLFKKACVNNVDEGLQAIDKHKIGYPLMVSAYQLFSKCKG